MPFANVSINGRRSGSGEDPGGTPGDGQGIKPFAGVADWNALKDSNTVLNLRQSQRGPNADRTFPIFSTDADGNDAGYYAYPKIYGEATFNEVDANGNIVGIGAGGWDGAKEDPISMFGPVEKNIVINGVSIPFLIYVQDWPGNGLQYWQVT